MLLFCIFVGLNSRIYFMKIYSILFAWLLVTFAYSQDAETVESVQGRSVFYRYSGALGVAVHTQGIKITYQKAVYENIYGRKFWEIEFSTLKDIKQARVNSYFGNTKHYYYGKLNNFNSLRLAYGIQKNVSEQGTKGAVNFFYKASAGVSIGILKPIYLQIVKNDSTVKSPTKEIEKYDIQKHNASNIWGRAGMFTGILGTKIYPGIHLNAALGMNFTSQPDNIREVVVGIQADLFYKKIPIMATYTTPPYFFTIYLQTYFGKKWN